ncbi:hypothetical protein CWR48_13975 [Oceanobacillus arenosus]|uniref:DUF3797 domain-containing protein n=1 Tax=Oceanobacillus arenosus TaxID=1229153 RepID=A0A3D8PR26_9BACI|nr:DUF3797 domain-containing protein [Oceanobacillus arenosus]RDW17619.1 hypothetical protein CWR48_13975 [Oceanobacillus arenosus]
MNAMDFLKISPFLNDCPNCGYDNVGTNDKTGEYHGTLDVDDNLYNRKCRCGFAVTIDANEGTSKKIIKSKIDIALEDFRKQTTAKSEQTSD